VAVHGESFTVKRGCRISGALLYVVLVEALHEGSDNCQAPIQSDEEPGIHE